MTAYINKIKSKAGDQQLPVTHERAVRDDNGTTLESKLQNLEGAIDKAYVAQSDNGMGRITLKKNIVGGVNTLTQSMMQATNTIYVIRYDFTLGEDITVPANCVLEFDGGSISASGSNDTVTGNNTGIKAGLVKIFNTDVTLAGTWNVVEAYPEWFGATGDGETDDADALEKCAAFKKNTVLLEGHTYKTSRTIRFYNSIIGNNATIDYTREVEAGIFQYPAIIFDNAEFYTIERLKLNSTRGGLFNLGCRNFKITDCDLFCVHSQIYISPYSLGGTDYPCENFEISNIMLDTNTTIRSDGIHINGGTRNGVISNIGGFTSDDFIALNALEVYEEAPYQGELVIENMVFNNICPNERCYRQLRIYSWGHLENNPSSIRNITFNCCRFVYAGESIAAPIIRVYPTDGIVAVSDAEIANGKTVLAENIQFNNCLFKTTTGLGTIGMFYTEGSFEFNNCIIENDHAGGRTFIFHGDPLLKVTCNNVTFGRVQFWYFGQIQNNNISLILKNCVNVPLDPVLVAYHENCNKLKLDLIADNIQFKKANATDRVVFANFSGSTGIFKASLRNIKLIDVYFSVNEIDVNADRCDGIIIHPNKFTTGLLQIDNSDLPTSVVNNVLYDVNDEAALRHRGNSLYSYSIPTYAVDGDFFQAKTRCGAELVYRNGIWNPSPLCGTTENRPAHPYRGQAYFDTTLFKEIFSSGIAWFDALGNPVDTVYPKVIGTPTAGNLAKFNSTDVHNIEDAGVASQV